MKAFLLALQQRDRVTDTEKAIVGAFSGRTRWVPAKTDIVVEGQSPRDSCLMLSGFSARYNIVGDGRRQITAVHVAGDFVDLHSLLLSRMDHCVTALCDCEIALVSHDLLRELSVTEPHLTRLFWLMTTIDAAIYRRWLVAAGRLSSVGQISHFLCEMFLRLDVVGLTQEGGFRLPISQAELSDAMGMSLVHVNRTLQRLRRDRLIEWQGEFVRILDWPGLRQVADFDPTYLDLSVAPR